MNARDDAVRLLQHYLIRNSGKTLDTTDGDYYVEVEIIVDNIIAAAVARIHQELNNQVSKCHAGQA